MTRSDDSSDKEGNDDSSEDSIMNSLEVTKRLLEVAVLVARLLRML